MPGTRAPSVDELIGALAASPAIYPQKLDPARQKVLLIRLDEAGYSKASFLDDRILNAQSEGAWAPLASVAEAAAGVRDPRPLHFVFHIGHVGSTLLSRLLDESGMVLGLREPLPLRMLADNFDPAILETLLRLWSRGFPSTRAVVVKATSSAARIGPHLLAARPQARAVYMYLPPEPYLATLLAGENSPRDLQGHEPGRTARLRALLGDAPTVHSLGELAAMSWLAERLTMTNLVDEYSSRVMPLDFDDLLSNTEGSLARVAQHFGLGIDGTALHMMAHSPALQKYSKAPEFEYSPQFRNEILAQSRRDNFAEIKKGMDWLANVARRHAKISALL